MAQVSGWKLTGKIRARVLQRTGVWNDEDLPVTRLDYLPHYIASSCKLIGSHSEII